MFSSAYFYPPRSHGHSCDRDRFRLLFSHTQTCIKHLRFLHRTSTLLASNIYASCIEHLRYVLQTSTICMMHIYASYIAHLGSLHARYRLLAWSGAITHIVSIGISQCQKPMEPMPKAINERFDLIGLSRCYNRYSLYTIISANFRK